jgi:hypothetical protein
MQGCSAGSTTGGIVSKHCAYLWCICETLGMTSFSRPPVFARTAGEVAARSEYSHHLPSLCRYLVPTKEEQ